MGILLDYACHRVIERFAEANTGKVDGLWFNKVLSLLAKRMTDEHGKDMRLPHCWYFWGDRVVVQDLPKQLRLATKEVDGVKSAFQWKGSRPKDPPSKEKKLINSLVDSIRSKYPRTPDGRKAILEAVYSYAPHEFQRLYAAFRTDSLELVRDYARHLQRELLRKDLRKAMEAFPFQEFPHLTVEATIVKLLGDSLLSRDDNKAQQFAVRVARRFWEEAFCRSLITRSEGSGNVSADTVSGWRRELDVKLPRYREELQSDTDKALEAFDIDALREDPTLRRFLSPGDWKVPSGESIDSTIYG